MCLFNYFCHYMQTTRRGPSGPGPGPYDKKLLYLVDIGNTSNTRGTVKRFLDIKLVVVLILKDNNH